MKATVFKSRMFPRFLFSSRVFQYFTRYGRVGRVQGRMSRLLTQTQSTVNVIDLEKPHKKYLPIIFTFHFSDQRDAEKSRG